jgi:hypothetical protein
VNDKTHFQSDVANVQYGDVSKVAKFEVASLASDGQTVLTATAKPPKGRKYAVLLLGTLDKDDNPLDFDVDIALASIGYIPAQEVKALAEAVEEPDDMDRFWIALHKLIGNEPLTTPQQEDAE